MHKPSIASPAARRVLLRLALLLVTAFAALACDLSDISGVPCVGCAATTRLEIHGDSVVVVGDAIVLRAVALQETVLFDSRHLPMRGAAWGTSTSNTIDLVAPPSVASDTATWGRALLIGRTVGMARITARADGYEAVKLVRVIPAS